MSISSDFLLLSAYSSENAGILLTGVLESPGQQCWQLYADAVNTCRQEITMMMMMTMMTKAKPRSRLHGRDMIHVIGRFLCNWKCSCVCSSSHSCSCSSCSCSCTRSCSSCSCSVVFCFWLHCLELTAQRPCRQSLNTFLFFFNTNVPSALQVFFTRMHYINSL